MLFYTITKLSLQTYFYIENRLQKKTEYLLKYLHLKYKFSYHIRFFNWKTIIKWIFFLKTRKCEQNQVFFKTGDPHPYCKNACEAHTMCGEVEVPEEHLEVCRVCNAFGQNCQSHESSKPAGPGN